MRPRLRSGTRSSKAHALTQVILAVFRANGLLLDAGDRLVAPIGLTSAWWQVLGAVAIAGRPLTAPQIAAAMGITRQGVQKRLKPMLAARLLDSRPNPDHSRAPLYALTNKGAQRYSAAEAIQAEWSNDLAASFSTTELQRASTTLAALAEGLRSQVGLD
jgi:DNA-binding MarR family transcriptional regulator